MAGVDNAYGAVILQSIRRPCAFVIRYDDHSGDITVSPNTHKSRGRPFHVSHLHRSLTANFARQICIEVLQVLPQIVEAVAPGPVIAVILQIADPRVVVLPNHWHSQCHTNELVN